MFLPPVLSATLLRLVYLAGSTGPTPPSHVSRRPTRISHFTREPSTHVERPVCPWEGRLEGCRCPEHRRIVVPAAKDLEATRQAVLRNAARNGDRRLPHLKGPRWARASNVVQTDTRHHPQVHASPFARRPNMLTNVTRPPGQMPWWPRTHRTERTKQTTKSASPQRRRG